MKIVGYTVGTSLPKPNFEQTDPTKGDYIKNKPDFDGLQSKVSDIEALVGDKPVSEQIDEAMAEVSLDGTYAYFEEDDILQEGSPATIDADSLGGLPASSYSTTEQIEAQYVKASIEEVVMGEVAMTKADIANKATEADNSAKLENKTINELFAMMFEVEHPVGSLYLSMSDTDDPNSKWSVFGIDCAWELVKDVFLLGAGENYELGTTGGEAEHTLTVEEMPAHRHKYGIDNSSNTFGGWTIPSAGAAAADIEGATEYVGGNQPHNNMPPYLATNIWKRIS